jgi:hypothetical protein
VLYSKQMLKDSDIDDVGYHLADVASGGLKWRRVYVGPAAGASRRPLPLV